MKITDSVYFYRGREEERLVRGAGSCNVIVIKSDRQVMIDTGLVVGGAFKDLLGAAFADGIDLRNTKAVLHTHSHWDHVTADFIVQRQYGADVYAHPWAKSAIESRSEGFKSFVLDAGEFYDEIFGAPAFLLRLLLRYAGGAYSGLRVDNILKGGEELDFGVRALVLHTPGHTPGHLAYYIPEDKVLVGGDVIDLETGTGADLNNPHSSYADGLASLERLRGMDIEAYLPSHGGPVLGRGNVDALIERTIENTHGYVEGVKAFLGRSQGTIADMLRVLMPGSPFTLKAMRMMQILTVLKHLRETGEVTVRKEAGRHVWSLNS